jgi:RNA polymerase sigma-70 factor (ECF subfamily)
MTKSTTTDQSAGMQSHSDVYDGLTEGLSEDDIRHIRSMTPPDNIITSEVLRRLREGDHESYRQVFLHWRRPIFQFVFNLIGNEKEAEDITQDIFVVLWNYRDRIDPERNIRSFLFLVARRTAYKSNRANQIRKKYANSAWMDDEDCFTSQNIVVEKEIELLKQAILRRMPSQQRKIFELSHNDGLTPEEIAERLGIKRESVYNQLSKARKAIRDAVLLLLFVFLSLPPDDSVLKTIIPC